MMDTALKAPEAPASLIPDSELFARAILAGWHHTLGPGCDPVLKYTHTYCGADKQEQTWAVTYEVKNGLPVFDTKARQAIEDILNRRHLEAWEAAKQARTALAAAEQRFKVFLQSGDTRG